MKYRIALAATCVTIAACGTWAEGGTRAGTPIELRSGDEDSYTRPDLVNEVLKSELVPYSSGTHALGQLTFVDGSTLIIDEWSEVLQGCLSVKIPFGESRFVYDFAGCLAIAELNENGTARIVTLLDRSPGTLGGPGRTWLLKGVPVAVGADVIVFDISETRGIALEYDPPALADAARIYQTECGLMPMVMTVDHDARITDYHGYPGELDGPCSHVI